MKDISAVRGGAGTSLNCLLGLWCKSLRPATPGQAAHCSVTPPTDQSRIFVILVILDNFQPAAISPTRVALTSENGSPSTIVQAVCGHIRQVRFNPHGHAIQPSCFGFNTQGYVPRIEPVVKSSLAFHAARFTESFIKFLFGHSVPSRQSNYCAVSVSYAHLDPPTG